jgi:microcystin-dependent protein
MSTTGPSTRLGLDAPLGDEPIKNGDDTLRAWRTALDAQVAKLTDLAALVPAGSMIAFGGSAAPTGWQLCDGSAISRTTFAGLFTAIGTAYGAGDGSTTFNLPDLRGRVAVGEDGAAGRLSANDARGNSSGEEKHTLSIAELPAHHHGLGIGDAGSANFTAGGVTGRYYNPALDDNSDDTGGGTAHNNMPPYQVVNHIIKT